MKIIIVGTTYPYRGGLAAYNERLAREYQCQGHDVEIYTFSLQYPSFLFPGKTQYSNEAIPTDLKIHRTINSINPISWIKTGKIIKKINPDQVIFCYWMAFMAPCFGTIARIARKANSKMIGLIHNMIPHEPSLLDKIFPLWFVNAMDGFVCMADSVALDVKKFDKKNKPVGISPHPIYDHFGELVDKNVAAEKLNLSCTQNYVLFFGFIRYYKGLDLLLAAFADERIRKLNLKLIVAGEFYEDSAYYLNLIHQHNLDNFVELHTDFVPDDDVRYYFSLSDIIVQPYRTATQSGVSQIAYHFEKPMIVTNVGGLPEMVPDRIVGYVTEVDKNDIADALIDFYENQRAEVFKKNLKKEKLKFTWSKMISTIDSLFAKQD